MEKRADFLDKFSVMNYSWMKEFASKFFAEHKKAYCFFAAEADKRGFFKIVDGPWGVMREFGSCSEKKGKVDHLELEEDDEEDDEEEAEDLNEEEIELLDLEENLIY